MRVPFLKFLRVQQHRLRGLTTRISSVAARRGLTRKQGYCTSTVRVSAENEHERHQIPFNPAGDVPPENHRTRRRDGAMQESWGPDHCCSVTRCKFDEKVMSNILIRRRDVQTLMIARSEVLPVVVLAVAMHGFRSHVTFLCHYTVRRCLPLAPLVFFGFGFGPVHLYCDFVNEFVVAGGWRLGCVE